MWQTMHTEITTAEPAAVWARYRDVSSWPEWDPGVKHVTIDSPLEAGARGVLTPASGPRVKFVVTDAQPERAFTDETRLPGARLRFSHTLEPLAGGGTRITHGITIAGPMTWLFQRVIGAGIGRELPDAVGRLAALAATAPTGP